MLGKIILELGLKFFKFIEFLDLARLSRGVFVRNLLFLHLFQWLVSRLVYLSRDLQIQIHIQRSLQWLKLTQGGVCEGGGIDMRRIRLLTAS